MMWRWQPTCGSSKSEAEEPRYLDQSLLKRPYNFTDDFMVKSQQINSRLVKDG